MQVVVLQVTYTDFEGDESTWVDSVWHTEAQAQERADSFDPAQYDTLFRYFKVGKFRDGFRFGT